MTYVIFDCFCVLPCFFNTCSSVTIPAIEQPSPGPNLKKEKEFEKESRKATDHRLIMGNEVTAMSEIPSPHPQCNKAEVSVWPLECELNVSEVSFCEGHGSRSLNGTIKNMAPTQHGAHLQEFPLRTTEKNKGEPPPPPPK